MLQYRVCGHLWNQGINRCPDANGRPNLRICTPQEAWAQEGINMQLNAEDAEHQRFLPQELDAQDQDIPGSCPACTGITPPSSRGSM